MYGGQSWQEFMDRMVFYTADHIIFGSSDSLEMNLMMSSLCL